MDSIMSEQIMLHEIQQEHTTTTITTSAATHHHCDLEEDTNNISSLSLPTVSEQDSLLLESQILTSASTTNESTATQLSNYSTSHERLHRIPLRSPAPFNTSINLLRPSQLDSIHYLNDNLLSSRSTLPATFQLPHTVEDVVITQKSETDKIEAPEDTATSSSPSSTFPIIQSPSVPSNLASTLTAFEAPQNIASRDRDPLRLSRFLAFPSQVGHHGAEVHLFDGLMSRNVHDIRLLRCGYYGIRLHNQNEAAWDSLYLGIGRMKAVVEFEIVPPPPELLASPHTKCYPTTRSEDTFPVASHKVSLFQNNETRQPISGKTHNSSISPERTSYESSPSAFPIVSKEDHIVEANTNDCPNDNLIKAKGTILTNSSTEENSSESGNELNRDHTFDDEDENNERSLDILKDPSESISVITNKGDLICKAQQEKVVYFYVSEAQSSLKLQAYASLTLGMRLRCSYDLIYCGYPKVSPSNPLVPFLRNASILCLDGGGVLGISSLKILERLELEVQKELRDPTVRITDCFDMICGTSTGGIISLGCLTGLTIKEMINMWASMSGRIFEGNRTLFSGIVFEGYDVTRLKNALVQGLGQRYMNTYTQPYCFVTSTDVKHNPYELFLLRNYTHSHLSNHEYRGGSAMPVWTAAWATAAAPTYLKGPNPEELEKMGLLIHPEVQLCDGAMKANNPTMVALEEAARLSGKKLQHFIESDLDVLVSIGTGQPTLKQTIEKTGIVSTFQILVNSAHLLTSSTNVHRDVLHWLGDHEDKYFRFNVPGIGDIPLDSIDKSSHDLIVKASNDYLTDEKYYDIKRLVKKLSYRIRH